MDATDDQHMRRLVRFATTWRDVVPDQRAAARRAYRRIGNEALAPALLAGNAAQALVEFVAPGVDQGIGQHGAGQQAGKDEKRQTHDEWRGRANGKAAMITGPSAAPAIDGPRV